MVLSLDQLVAQSGSAKTSKLSLDDLVSASKPTTASTKVVTDAQDAPAATPAPTRGTFADVGIGAVKGGVGFLSAADVLTTMNRLQKGDPGAVSSAGARGLFDSLSPLATMIKMAGGNPDWAGTQKSEAGPQTPNFTGQSPQDFQAAVTPQNPAQVFGGKVANAAFQLAPFLKGFMGAKAEPPVKEAPATTEAPTVSPIQPTRVGSTPHADYAAKQGYEPYTPHYQLPVIEMGDKSGRIPSPLPTIEAGAPRTAKVKGDVTFVPEKGGLPPLTTMDRPTARATSAVKPIEGTGTTKVRGLSEGVEATAIEKKLTDTLGDLPEYKTVSMKDQAQKAAQIMTDNPDLGRAIAMGEKAPPAGVLPESVFVAAEHDAIMRGDVETMTHLANSRLASSATTMGQRIRTLGERDTASPIQAIQAIQKARAEAIARRGNETPETVVKRAQTAIRSTHTKQSWGEFVNSITC